MKDLFKKLFEGEELPQELKGEVKTTLETTKMLLNVADLFTGKFVQTNLALLNGLHDDALKKEPKQND